MVTIQQANTMFVKEVQKVKSLLGVDLTADGWSLTTNRRKRALGLCYYAKKQVQLSVYFLETADQDHVRETIIHEIAHALTPGAKHGKDWRDIYVYLGGNGKRMATMGVDCNALKVKAKYALVDSRNDEILIEYHSKPRRNAANPSIKGDPGSRGKLEYRVIK